MPDRESAADKIPNPVFLNEIVEQLWPNINVAGSQMIKEIAEPMFKTMLPGPLKTLHFTKIDLGTVPLKLNGVLVSKTASEGIKLDMNVDWDGECDIKLDADLIPELGVKHVKLRGRLSILLGPLTNIIPLIGAAQIAFINPPLLELDFTGAANVADFSAIDGAVRGVILSIINSMFTLPNRFLLTLDAKNDYFKTYLPPLGVIRITVEKAWDFADEAKGKAKKLFAKLTRAAPDTYAKVDVGAEPSWQTQTKDNTVNPSWGETHDFVVSDFHQCIKVHIFDKDVNSDDEIGMGITTVEEVLRNGGRQELALELKGEDIGGKVSIACEYFKLDANGGNSFTASTHKGDGRVSGVAAVLVSGAYGIKGQREQLTPSVKVTMGQKNSFRTAIKSDFPGTDINNPTFDQSFRIPVTSDSGSDSFRIALLNGEQEVGAVEVPFSDVQNAPEMTLSNKFDVGGGTTVRASICLKGLSSASAQEINLPRR
jgi:Ca2+-dependent lipid-binding protein